VEYAAGAAAPDGFFPTETGLRTEGRHPSLGVSASGFRPLCNIPHCCLPEEAGPCLSPSVAGHPLRPATRQSLGRPLPHQQADRPRVHPKPLQTFNQPPCDGQSYPVLDPVSRAYPRVKRSLLTCYSPVRHSSTPSKLGASAFDLHVLSTPPAFILSQDQTLHTKTMKQFNQTDQAGNSPIPGNTTTTTRRYDNCGNHSKKMASNKLGTLLSSQTTTHTQQQPHKHETITRQRNKNDSHAANHTKPAQNTTLNNTTTQCQIKEQ